MTDLLIQPGFLSLDEQRQVVSVAKQIEPGFYVPRTRFNQPMRLRMNCLGHHWSAKDYQYHPTRVDADGLPCPPIPSLYQSLAQRALTETGYLSPEQLRPYDICIVNWYAEEVGRLGDHVDNSESKQSLAGGYPVVSLSVGASCIFRAGGLERRDRYEEHVLHSGDLVVFGRSRRLMYHGVKKLLPGTTPPELGLGEPGRINLTFRVL